MASRLQLVYSHWQLPSRFHHQCSPGSTLPKLSGLSHQDFVRYSTTAAQTSPSVKMVRIKERYLLVNILYPGDIGTKPDVPDLVVINQPTTDNLTPGALLRGIRDEIANLFGDYGSGAIEGGGLSVKYLSTATSTFILRVSRSHFRLVWAALTFMDFVPVKNGKLCTFRVVRVSGTIRKAEEEAIRRSRNLILAVQDGRRDNPKSEDPLGSIFGESKRPRRQVSMRNPAEVEDPINDVEMGEVSDD